MMSLNWLDYSLIAILLISTLISLLRGFVREILSLIAWVLAIWIAFKFNAWMLHVLAGVIKNDMARYSAAFLILFFGTLIICGLMNMVITHFTDKLGLGGTDRMLGMLFGMGRGVLVVSVLVMVFSYTPMTKQIFWQKSVAIPIVQPMSDWLAGFIPKDFEKQLKANMQQLASQQNSQSNEN